MALDLQLFNNQAPGTFNPQRTPNILPEVRENNQVLQQTAEVQYQGVLDNLRRQGQADVAQQQKTYEQLGQFSKSAFELGAKLYEQKQDQLDAEFLWDLQTGKIQIDEGKVQALRTQQEVEDQALDEVKSAALKNGATTPGIFTKVLRLDEVKGRRRRIANQYVLGKARSQFVQDYNEFIKQLGQQDIEPEQAEAASRQFFLDWVQANGISPKSFDVASLHSYFLPKLDEIQAKGLDELTTTIDLRKSFDQEDQLFNSLGQADAEGNYTSGQSVVKSLMSLLNQKTGKLYTPAEAHDRFIEKLREMADAVNETGETLLPQETANAILNQVDAVTGESYASKWPTRAGRIRDIWNEENSKNVRQQFQENDNIRKQLEQKFNEETAIREAEGRPWTEADLRELANDYTSRGLGPAPSYLKDYLTKEDRLDQADKERLDKLLVSRKFLTSEDLRNVSTEVAKSYMSLVKQGDELANVPEQTLKDAKEEIIAKVNKYTLEETGSQEKTQRWTRIKQNALAAYERYYREYIIHGNTPADADIKARDRVMKNMDAGTYEKAPTASNDQTARLNFVRANAAMSQLNTAILPGTEKDFQVLVEYARTGRGDIPLIYKQLALGHRGLTGWDIANAQLEASGVGVTLMRPKAAEFVDMTDPSLRRLLTYKPTTSRTARAVMSSGGYKQMLDLVASQESTSYGGYDAMNTGGTAGGDIPYGSANSKNVFGRGLSQMTIGEVMNLQARDKVHAAGRYQIIGSTLKGLINGGAGGLTPNDLFNSVNQDKLAIALVNRRLAERNKFAGFRNEWRGLRKVSDAVLQNAIAAINSDSPFNQPQNLLPRLVYRIGNRGYGSTGPHLDAKPVRPGTTQTDRSLPPISKTELDRYVVVGQKQTPLSQGTVTTDNDSSHRGRGSFGHDFAAPDGTPVFLKNGARVVSSFKGDQGTDHLIIELPDGRRYQFLHGTKA